MLPPYARDDTSQLPQKDVGRKKLDYKQKLLRRLAIPMLPDLADAVWKLLITAYISLSIKIISLFTLPLRVRKWCPWSPYEANSPVRNVSVPRPWKHPGISLTDQQGFYDRELISPR